MIKKLLVASTLSLLFVASWGFSWSLLLRGQKVKGATTDVSPSQIIALTNLERNKAGAPSLQPNALLDQAALAKAQDMFSKDYFAHLDPQGNGPWVFISQSGYEYYHAGENLARNFASAQDVVNAWINSPSHKANLLSPNYTEIGLAVIEQKNQIYIVQLLASPLPLEFSSAPNPGENFTGTLPLTGQMSLINPQLTLPLISLTIAIFVVIIGTQAFRAMHQAIIRLSKPDVSYWKKI